MKDTFIICKLFPRLFLFFLSVAFSLLLIYFFTFFCCCFFKSKKNPYFEFKINYSFLSFMFTGLLRYKVDLMSIQLDDGYYDDVEYDLNEY